VRAVDVQPRLARTAVDFLAGRRLVEQLATSTANAANATSFRVY
jgi:hypothetical protein